MLPPLFYVIFQACQPSEKQIRPFFWILLLILLAVCVIGIAVLVYQAYRPQLHENQPQVAHSPSSQSLRPQEVMEQPAIPVAATYAYAGSPRSQSVTDTILVLTNTGYLVGYSEAKEDPVWVCYRLFRVNSLQPDGKFHGIESVVGLDRFVQTG